MVKLPARFNPARLLADDHTWFAEIPVIQFRRFAEVLAGDEGNVHIEMRLSREPSQQRIIADGKFKATCVMVCQRCLQEMQQVVSGEFSLTFVQDEKAANALPEELDPVILDEKGQIHIVDLLEDDLILQAPVAPVHADLKICSENGYIQLQESADGDENSAEKSNQKNPFDVLKNLTQND